MRDAYRDRYRFFLPLLGLLPPPLRGRGEEGGGANAERRAKLPPSRRPSAADLPRKGGGRANLAFVILLVASLLAVLPALALTFPALTGRVVDDANILDPATRAALTQKLADLEAKSTDQVVVVTLKSLQGTSIEDFGYQLGRHWQIGQKDKNNGVLLIVAPSERKVRIEVGYGLEGTLTDLVARFIIDNSVLPRFRANDYPGGINRGVDDIIQVLTGDAEEWKQRAAKQRPDQMPDWMSVALIILVILIFFLVFSMMAGAASRAQPGKRGRGSPWIVIPPSSGSSWSSGSSGGSWGGGFSGGGGSFGGGGSSGSW